jgi:hypothetical protein
MTCAPATNLRATTAPTLMQIHPERIVVAKDDRPEEEPLLESFSSSPK